MRWIGWLVALTACESGLATVLEVEVATPVTNSFSTTAPGVLVSDVGFSAQAFGAVCGEPIEPFVVSIDHGFGCLEDGQKGSKETVQAWVQPMPEGWDAGALCALGPPNGDPIALSSEITGSATSTTGVDTPVGSSSIGTQFVGIGLDLAPESTWAQGQTELEWHKVPICGGVLRGDPVTVTLP